MTYVVVIVRVVVREDGTKDFKAFSQSADAIKRYNSACHYLYSGNLVSVSGSEETRIACFKCSVLPILRMPEKRLTSSRNGRQKYYIQKFTIDKERTLHQLTSCED